jgi:hypothetical protein
MVGVGFVNAFKLRFVGVDAVLNCLGFLRLLRYLTFDLTFKHQDLVLALVLRIL